MYVHAWVSALLLDSNSILHYTLASHYLSLLSTFLSLRISVKYFKESAEWPRSLSRLLPSSLANSLTL